MKRNRWKSLLGVFIGVFGLLLLVGSPNFDVFGQSKAAGMDSTTANKYVRLSDAKIRDVRVKAEKFYGMQDLPEFTAKGAKVKHIGRGVITFEDADQSELDLDVNPCNSDVDVFHKPYRRTALSKTVTCNGKLLTYYEIEQK